MLVRMEKGRAINMAISETYKVLIIKGRKPKSPLKGFQSEEVSNTHRFFSLIIGKALKKRLNPIMRRKSMVKMAMPSIKYRAVLSFAALRPCILIYCIFFSSVSIRSFEREM
jgi:hypothetical protein